MKIHRLITIVSGIALLALAHSASARPTWTTLQVEIQAWGNASMEDVTAP